MKLLHVIGSLTEIEAATNCLDTEMNADLELDCENITNNHQLNKQLECSILTTPSYSSIDKGSSATTKNNKI